MSTEPEEPGHGHSPAAWTAVVIMLIGFTIGTVAFFLVGTVPAFAGAAWVVCASAVVVLIGLAVGWGMAKAGYGAKGPKYSPKAH